MKKVDRVLMTRVFAFVAMLSLAAIPVGGGVVGFAVKYIEIPDLFIWMSLGIILLFITQIFNKSLYELNGETSPVEVGYETTQGV